MKPDPGEEILSVPGFGYYSRTFKEHLDFLVNLTLPGSNESQPENISSSVSLNRLKCDILSSLHSGGLDLSGGENNKVLSNWCPPLWDNISCLPATAPGNLGVLPCMSEHYGVLFNTADNASRYCLPDGSWSPKTNYSSCRVLSPEQDPQSVPEEPEANIILYIYIVGYSLSILALILSLSILLGFRELRCLRNKIHSNLFLTFLLSNSVFLFTLLLQGIWLKDTVLICINHALVRYFHLSTFFWMFVEGLYLFLQVKTPYSFHVVKLRHYMMIGWGFPCLVLIKWLILVLCFQKPHSPLNATPFPEDDESFLTICPLLTGSSLTEWIYSLPVLLLLASNVLFLLWISVIVLSQLSSANSSSGNNHLKALRGLLLLIPILGLTYALTLAGPQQPPTLRSAFLLGRALLLSGQGLLLTLPYCFMNREVRAALRSRMDRWRLARSINGEAGRRKSLGLTLESTLECVHLRKESIPLDEL